MNLFNALRPTRATCRSSQSALPWNKEGVAARPSPPERSCRFKQAIVRIVTGLRIGTAAFAALLALAFAPAAAAYTPAAPTGLTATAGEGEVVLSWSKSWIDSGAGEDADNDWWLDGYQVRYRKGASFPNGGGWRNISGSTFRTTTHTVTGLENGADYVFQIRRAYDVFPPWGWWYSRQYGPSSGVAAATPRGPALAFDGAATIADQSYVQGAAIAALVLPAATGGNGALSYALTPTLPAGLSLDMATRTVSGTPTALQAATSYSWTVNDTDGDSASLNFSIEVVAPSQQLTFGDASVPDVVWLVYYVEWDMQLPAATGGVGAVSYALSPALPEGLAFTASDRRIKGWGSARGVSDFKTYTLTATDAVGQQASLTFKFRLGYIRPAIPANFAAQAGNGQVTLDWDDPDDPNVDHYELRYRKGGGFSGDGGWTKIAGSSGTTTSHVVTGLENGAQYAFQIRSADALPGHEVNESQPSVTVTATPNAVPGAPTGLTAVGGNGRLALAWTLPTNTTDIEKQQVRWKVTSALPFTAGDAWTDLAGDATSHQVTGLSNDIAVSVELRAVNGLGAGPAATVAGTPQDLTPSFGDATITDRSFAQNAAIAAFVLPEASGGDGTLSYALTPDLPAGLVLDVATRTVSGTPTALQAATSYSWTVTDADGDSASLSFTIEVVAPSQQLTFGDASVPDLDWTFAGLWNYQLPAATGGAGAVSYALTPALPEGLAFTASDRRVKGRGSADETSWTYTTYTLTATDAAGQQASLTFELRIKYLEPDKPANFVAQAGDEQVTLSWDDPDDPHMTDYELRYRKGEHFSDDSGWTKIAGSSGATTSHVVTGLENGSQYVFQIRAVYRFRDYTNESYASDAVTVTLPTVPGAPTGLTAVGGNGRLALSWALPTNTTDIEKQQVRWKVTSALPFTASDAWTDLAGDATSHQVTGLANGIAVSVELRAMNRKGTGPAATVSGTPQDLTPSFGTTTIANRGVVQNAAIAAFVLPEASGGDGTLSYALTPDLPAGLSLDMATRTVSGTPTALQAATSYSWTVTDADGDSASLSFTMQVLTPAQLLTFGDASVPDLDWRFTDLWNYQLPAATGGAGTVSYALTPALPEGLAFTASDRRVKGRGTARSADAGLVREYTTYTLTATDATGQQASLTFELRLSYYVPDKPANVVAQSGDGQVTLSWDDPDDPHMSDYELRYSKGTSIGGHGGWTKIAGSSGATTSHVVTGLENGSQYVFQIRAIYTLSGPVSYTNGSVPSDAVTATPNAVPGAPTGLTAVGGNGGLALAWTLPTNTTDIEKQQVRWKVTSALPFTASDAWTDIAGDATSHQVTGLANDIAVSIELRAVNGLGAGPAATVAGTPQDLTPSFGTATIADRSLAQNAAIAAFVLPEASGGDGTPSYALSPDLPAGLALDAATRTVSGTPTTLQAATSYSWTATDADGDSASLSFTMQVVTPAHLLTFGDASVRDLYWLVYWEEREEQLPAATGGLGAVSYALTPTLPEGLAFTASDRRIKGWGSPRGESDFKTYTLTASDTVGQEASLTFKLRVGYIRPAIPANFAAQAGDGQVTLNWDDPDDPNVDYYELRYRKGGGLSGDGGWTKIAGSSGATTSHVVTGLENGAQYAFQIRSAHIKPGLINEGKPSVTVTAVPKAVPGAPTGLTAVGGNGGLALAWTLPTSTTAIEKQQLRWKVTSALPFTASDAWTDLAGDATSHQVTGLANGIAVSVELRAVNGLGAGPAATVAGTPQDPTPSFGAETIADRNVVQNVAIAAFALPEASGGDGTLSYALTPTLPAGLSLDMATRTVSGTPTALQAATSYSWTVTDADGDVASLPFTIRVVATGELPSFGSETIPELTWIVGHPGSYSLTLPAATGGTGALTYSLTPALPAGVTFDGATRELAGVPRNGPHYTTYTYTAEDDSGNRASLTFIMDNPVFNGSEFEPANLAVEAGNGQVTLTWNAPPYIGLQHYEMRFTDGAGFGDDDGWTQIPGSDTTSRVVTGLTNGTAYRFELRAINTFGASRSIAITATPQDQVPSFGTATIADRSLAQNAAIAAFVLPEASGGDGTLSYALTPDLPAGLVLDMATRTVSGTPTALQAATSYSWTATDADGDSASLSFTMPVVTPAQLLTFGDASVPDVVWLVYYVEWDMQLPAATGGVGAVSYALSPALPEGLAFTAPDRRIKGWGSARGVSDFKTYTLTATDAVGQQASLTFKFRLGYIRPAIPANFAAQAGNGQVTLDWDDPDDPNVDHYELRYRKGGGFSGDGGWTKIAGSSGATTSHVVTGLENGAQYAFQIRSAHVKPGAYINESEPSVTVTAVPKAVPGAPTGLTAVGGNGRLALAWTLPTNTTDIEKQQMRWKVTSALPFTASDAWTDIAADATSHQVTGLANGIAVSLELRAVNGLGAGPAATVAGTPQDPTPSFGAETIADRNVVQNVAIAAFALPEASGGDGTLSYALTPTLPAGLSLDMATRTVSGTPTALQAATSYSWTVTDADGDVASLAFTIRVVATGELPSFGSETIPELTWIVGHPGSYGLTLPAATGGTGALTYSLTPALPAGVTFDGATRELAGVPWNGPHYTTYTYTAEDDSGNRASLTFVMDNPVFIGSEYEPANLAVEAGNGQVTLTWNAPPDSGLQHYEMRFTDGAGFGDDDGWTQIPGSDTTSRVVTGLTNGTAYRFELRAINTFGASRSNAITATPQDLTPSFGTETIANRSLAQSAAIAAFVLPEASGGDGTLSYALTPDLPAGLVLDVATRTVSGTPTALQAATSYSWTATDADGDSASLSFTMQVLTPAQLLTFGDASVRDLVWLVYWEEREEQLPAATGGVGAVSYALTPTLPEGLAFTASDRRIKGWGSARGVSDFKTYTLTASDTVGQEASLTFKLRLDYVRPAIPANLAAQAGNGQVTLDWDDPDDPNVDHYELRYRKGGGFSGDGGWTKIAGSSGATTSHVVTGLENDAQYAFQIRSVHVKPGHYINVSEPSVTVTAVPNAVPGAPTGLTAVGGNGGLALAWTLPTNTTDIEKQQLRWKITSALPFTASDAWTDTAGDATNYQVTGLANDIAVSVELRAVNGLGAGPVATVSGTPQDLTVSFGTATIADRSLAQNVAIAAFALPEASGGDGTLSYALTPELPAGLSLDMATRTVSGTPTAALAVTTYSWTATDEDGDAASLSFTIEVAAGGGANAAARQAFGKSLAGMAASMLDGAQQTIGQRLSSAPGAFNLTLAGRQVEFGAASEPVEFDWRERGMAFDGDDDQQRVSWEEFRRDSAFEMAFRESASGLEMTAWGQGGLTSFRAEGAATSHDNRMETGWLGMDARMGDGLLTGFAYSRSAGETEASDGAGFTTALDAAWPYMQLKLAGGTEVWTMLGAGNGSVEYRPAEGSGESRALEMRLASAGGRQPLAKLGALDLALDADAGFVSLETGGTTRSVTGGHEVQVWRARASLEAEHEGWDLGNTSLAPFGSLAWRGEGGDWQDGSGVEAGFGARLLAPGSRFALVAEGRHLALSTGTGHVGTGASLTAGLEPAADGAGLSWSASLATGMRADGGAMMLADDLDHVAAGLVSDDDHTAFELEARYGFRLPATHGLLSPLLRLSHEEGNGRDIEAGLSLQAEKGRVDLELAAGHEYRNGSADNTRFRLDLRLGF